MELKAAVDFIKDAVVPAKGNWADIGAGAGIYTQALDRILESGSTIIAADKNPHMLYRLRLANCHLVVEELDFNREFALPPQDGIVMANALHYAADQISALRRVVACLKPGGRLLMIEYETDRPLSPWIPYPLPFEKYFNIAGQSGLSKPEPVNQIPSAFGHDHIYLAVAAKK